MPRTVMLLALILTLMTGLVLGQMSSLGQKPVQIAATSDSGAAEISRAFYRAINQYLRTGDAQTLEQLLAPGFAGHVPHVVVGESAEAFLQYLQSLRSTFPGLQLEVSELSARASIVAVDVQLVGETEGSFAGLAVNAGLGMSGYEVLRIEGDQIVERWASRELPPLYRTAIVAGSPASPIVMFEPRIQRLALEPNGFVEFDDRQGFILVGETGSNTLHISNLPESSNAPALPLQSLDPVAGLPVEGEFVALDPGEAVSVLPDRRTRIANSGDTLATSLLISVDLPEFGPVSVSPQEVLESIGMEWTMMVGGGRLPPLEGEQSWQVSVGQVTLPPGAEIPRHATGPAELIAVFAGAVEVSVHKRSIVWHQPGKISAVIDGRQTISAGEGMRANAGAVVEYRAAGVEPATLWVVTISSDAATRPADPL